MGHRRQWFVQRHHEWPDHPFYGIRCSCGRYSGPLYQRPAWTGRFYNDSHLANVGEEQ